MNSNISNNTKHDSFLEHFNDGKSYIQIVCYHTGKY